MSVVSSFLMVRKPRLSYLWCPRCFTCFTTTCLLLGRVNKISKASIHLHANNYLKVQIVLYLIGPLIRPRLAPTMCCQSFPFSLFAVQVKSQLTSVAFEVITLTGNVFSEIPESTENTSSVDSSSSYSLARVLTEQPITCVKDTKLFPANVAKV